MGVDYEELNERVEKALQRRKKITRGIMFAMSIVMFLLFTLIAWLIASGAVDAASVTNPDMDAVTSALILLTLGGFMSVLFNAIGFATDSGLFDKQMRSQILMEEFGQNLQELAQVKKKRSQMAETRLSEEEIMELSDDGELIPLKEQRKSGKS